VSPLTQTPDSGLRRTELPNGLTVLSEYMPGVRSVSFGAWVRAASVHETRERMGVSHLLEHMVFKGTRTRSAREIALSLEVLGGSLDAYTAREHTSFQERTHQGVNGLRRFVVEHPTRARGLNRLQALDARRRAE